MSTLEDLRALLHRIDGGNYGAYKQARGLWFGARFDLAIDHVQGDPFAAPSVVRLRVHDHGFDERTLAPDPSRTATCDLLLRRFANATTRVQRNGSGKSGVIDVDAGRATILPRSGCDVVDGALELRFRVGLPARGRRVMGRAAASLLLDALPRALDSVRADAVPTDDLDAWRRSALDHQALSAQLTEAGLVAFVADGACLPRASGVDQAPLRGAVPMHAPESLRVELRDAEGKAVVGLGIPHGVTLITGAGFHGKSTLLQALAEGIYPHIPGDGRERVVTLPSATKVRSEDGRAVTRVDLRPFITDLPGSRDPASFSTPDASGSTSLAAAIVESVEVGARALLLDEDTCATNLLVRDARMQALIARDTIVPLVDRVRQLHRDRGVSCVLVVGGSGDYLDVADTVITMDTYAPSDRTEAARSVCASLPSRRDDAPPLPGWPEAVRSALPASVAPKKRGHKPGKVRARGLRDLSYGDETLCLDGLDQLVDPSQVRTLGLLLEWVSRQSQTSPIEQLARGAVEAAKQQGLYGMRASPELAAVRPAEVAAAINRLRALQVG